MDATLNTEETRRTMKLSRLESHAIFRADGVRQFSSPWGNRRVAALPDVPIPSNIDNPAMLETLGPVLAPVRESSSGVGHSTTTHGEAASNSPVTLLVELSNAFSQAHPSSRLWCGPLRRGRVRPRT